MQQKIDFAINIITRVCVSVRQRIYYFDELQTSIAFELSN